MIKNYNVLMNGIYKKLRKYVFIFILTIFIINSFCKVKSYFRSILVTLNVMDGKKFSYIDKFVKVKQIYKTYNYKNEKFPVKIFKPVGKDKCPVVLVTHGLAPRGFDDWRLVAFAKTLAKTGCVVFMPNFELLKQVKIKMSTVDKVRFIFNKMLELKFVNPDRAGIFAISYSGGPVTIAFSDKKYSSKLKYIIYLGGYYDLSNVLVFGLSGHSTFKGYDYYTKPSKWGRWYYLLSNIDYVETESDKRLLRRIAELRKYNPDDDISEFEKKLSDKGKKLLEMIKTSDHKKIRALIKKQSLRFRNTLKVMSPELYIKNLTGVKIYLLHASNDPLIPFTESFLFREKLIKNKIPASLTLINALEHVDVVKKKFTFKNIISFYLPELVKMSNIIYEIITN